MTKTLTEPNKQNHDSNDNEGCHQRRRSGVMLARGHRVPSKLFHKLSKTISVNGCTTRRKDSRWKLQGTELCVRGAQAKFILSAEKFTELIKTGTDCSQCARSRSILALNLGAVTTVPRIRFEVKWCRWRRSPDWAWVGVFPFTKLIDKASLVPVAQHVYPRSYPRWFGLTNRGRRRGHRHPKCSWSRAVLQTSTLTAQLQSGTPPGCTWLHSCQARVQDALHVVADREVALLLRIELLSVTLPWTKLKRITLWKSKFSQIVEEFMCFLERCQEKRTISFFCVPTYQPMQEFGVIAHKPFLQAPCWLHMSEEWSQHWVLHSAESFCPPSS